MIGMLFDGAKLFFTGRLFQDYSKVIQNFLIAMLLGCAVVIAVGYLTTPLIGAIAGGAVAGLLQPYLFKNLKYK